MRIVMLSKALVVGAHQRKLEVLGGLRDVDLTCVVPPAWGDQRLEPLFLNGYRLAIRPIRFNGNFHLFHFSALGRLLREVEPDIVHVDEEPYNLATFLATRQAVAVGARPLFFTWQNLRRRYPPPFRWMERYVFRSARCAIAGSAEAGDVLRWKGYRGPVAIIPQFGIDPELFAPRADRPEDGAFAVGYAGRLVAEKGLFVLLDALTGLGGSWRLTLLGDGPLRTELATRARVLGIDRRVTLEPAVPSVEIPRRLARLDVLVLPSVTRPNWKEQFGRVLIEAMASEVPVIGSTSGEIPNVIGDAGLIFPEADPAALRASLQRLAADPALRAELGRRGRARVLERFTHERIANQTLEVYRRMMAGVE